MAKHTVTAVSPAPDDLPSPEILKRRFLEYMRIKNNSARTLEQWTYTLGRFLEWLAQHGIDSLLEVTPQVLAAYRRYLYHYRNPRTLQPIKFATQSMYLMAVRRYLRLAGRPGIPAGESRFKARTSQRRAAAAGRCADGH